MVVTRSASLQARLSKSSDDADVERCVSMKPGDAEWVFHAPDFCMDTKL